MRQGTAGQAHGGGYKNISCLNCFDSSAPIENKATNDSDFWQVDFLKLWMHPTAAESAPSFECARAARFPAMGGLRKVLKEYA